MAVPPAIGRAPFEAGGAGLVGGLGFGKGAGIAGPAVADP